MTRIHRGIAAILVALLLVAEPGGCQPEGDQTPPADDPAFVQPPVEVLQEDCKETSPPSPAAPGQEAAVETAVFWVCTWDEYGNLTHRGIAVTVTALGADLKAARAIDDVTGEEHPNPMWLMRRTPYSYRMGFGAGVVAGSISVAVILEPRETVACWVEVDGQEVDGTFEKKTLESVLDKESEVEGSVKVSCLYAVGAG